MKTKLTKTFKTAALLGSMLCSVAVMAQMAQPAGAGPDFSVAIEKLGITATELATALGSPPNFVAAAEKFDMPVKEFTALLPAPPAAEIPEGLTAEDFMQP